MPSTILSDNGVTSNTSGIKVAGSNDGILELQTTTAGGTATTAITIDTGQRSKFPTTIGVGGATPATSGSGISFPASASASSDANTLDDYEEGTFSPGFRGSTSAGTYSFSGSSTARYIKIGKSVTVCFGGTLTVSSAGSGYAQFTGLPFTNNGPACGCTRTDGVTYQATTKSMDIEFIASSGTTLLNWHENGNGSGGTDTAVTNFSNGAYLIVSITYLTDQ
jgi:hypothetical protein